MATTIGQLGVTFPDATVQSTALPAFGTSGNVLTSTGNAWVSAAATGGGGGALTITTLNYTATAGQTVFAASYTVGNLGVWRNGVKLGLADYVATNGTSVVLAAPANLGDLVEIETYQTTGTTTVTTTDFTATGGQTLFTVGYTVGYLSVYRNGIKLGQTDFTATNGTTFTLAVPAAAGDLIETVAIGGAAPSVIGVAQGGTGLTTVGTVGNVLTSNGTAWISSAPGGGSGGGAQVTNPMSSNITLTSASAKVQILTPNADTRTITLPNATTISSAGGPIFVLQNTVTAYPIAVLDSAGNNVGWVTSTSQTEVFLESTATATGNWKLTAFSPAADGGLYAYNSLYPSIGQVVVTPPLRLMGFKLNDTVVAAVYPNANTNLFWTASYCSPNASHRVSAFNILSNDTQVGAANWHACLLDSTRVVSVALKQTTNVEVLVTSFVDAGTSITVTPGVANVVGTGGGSGSPFVVKLDTNKIAVLWGSNANEFSVRIGTIVGTTITFGTAATLPGVIVSTRQSIAVLSPSLIHVNTGTSVYSFGISGTTLTNNGFVTTAGTGYGIVPVTATTSMVFYSSGLGAVGVVVTDTGGTPTLGTVSGILAAGGISVNIIANTVSPGIALLVNNASAFGGGDPSEPEFTFIEVSGGIPVVKSSGFLPYAVYGQPLMSTENGTIVMPNCQIVRNSSTSASVGYVTYAVTGGV